MAGPSARSRCAVGPGGSSRVRGRGGTVTTTAHRCLQASGDKHRSGFKSLETREPLPSATFARERHQQQLACALATVCARGAARSEAQGPHAPQIPQAPYAADPRSTSSSSKYRKHRAIPRFQSTPGTRPRYLGALVPRGPKPKGSWALESWDRSVLAVFWGS